MVKYQYKTYNAKENKALRGIWKSPENLDKFLNEMGSQGWKLAHERDLAGTWTLIFRRKIE